MNNSGCIVKTKTGKQGYTKNNDKPIQGKIIVYLEKDNKPVLDEKGNQIKLLCNKADLKIIGYMD